MSVHLLRLPSLAAGHLLIWVACFLHSHHSKAQVCDLGYLEFYNQAMIDAFPATYPGCHIFTGTIHVFGSGVTSLDSLYPIQQINGNLSFSGIQISDFKGLDNLTDIYGGFWIDGINSLSSFAGLDALNTIHSDLAITFSSLPSSVDGFNTLNYVGGNLSFTFNYTISEINGFNNLTIIENGLYFAYNYELTAINGFQNLTQVNGFLGIDSNPVLSIISGFSSLNSIYGYFGFSSNAGINTLDAFHNLSWVSGSLQIWSNDNLSTISGFENLSGAASIEIYSNLQLTSIDGFSILSPALTGNLGVSGNPQLSNCAVPWICDFIDAKPGSSYIQSNALGCHSVAAVQVACAALPVELVYFMAYPDGPSTALTWHTASEQNTSHFAIQHSTDGVVFKDIGAMPAKGTTTEPQTYRFIHQRPAYGHNYYRLHIVDFDGSFEYSNVAHIRMEGHEDHLLISPNPASGAFQVQWSRPPQQAGELLLRHLTGQTVFRQAVPAGQQQVQIHVPGLEAGLYLLEWRDAYGRVVCERVVVGRP